MLEKMIFVSLHLPMIKQPILIASGSFFSLQSQQAKHQKKQHIYSRVTKKPPAGGFFVTSYRTIETPQM